MYGPFPNQPTTQLIIISIKRSLLTISELACRYLEVELAASVYYNLSEGLQQFGWQQI